MLCAAWLNKWDAAYREAYNLSTNIPFLIDADKISNSKAAKQCVYH